MYMNYFICIFSYKTLIVSSLLFSQRSQNPSKIQLVRNIFKKILVMFLVIHTVHVVPLKKQALFLSTQFLLGSEKMMVFSDRCCDSYSRI